MMRIVAIVLLLGMQQNFSDRSMVYEIITTKPDGTVRVAFFTTPLASDDGSWVVTNRKTGRGSKLGFNGQSIVSPGTNVIVPRSNLPDLPCESLWPRLLSGPTTERHDALGQRNMLLYMLEYQNPHERLEYLRYGFSIDYHCTPIFIEAKLVDGAVVRYIAKRVEVHQSSHFSVSGFLNAITRLRPPQPRPAIHCSAWTDRSGYHSSYNEAGNFPRDPSCAA